MFGQLGRLRSRTACFYASRFLRGTAVRILEGLQNIEHVSSIHAIKCTPRTEPVRAGSVQNRSEVNANLGASPNSNAVGLLAALERLPRVTRTRPHFRRRGPSCPRLASRPQCRARPRALVGARLSHSSLRPWASGLVFSRHHATCRPCPRVRSRRERTTILRIARDLFLVTLRRSSAKRVRGL